MTDEQIVIIAGRQCDYNPTTDITVTETSYGDVAITLISTEEHASVTVEFTQSGSQSPHTREAIKALLLAMIKDGEAK